MRTPTLTPVAVLATERSTGWTDNTEQGISIYRPTGTPRKNDGVKSFWMLPGETYHLRWDGLGWAISNHLWDAGHRYRLGTPDGQGFTRTVLTADGVDMELESGLEYAVRLVEAVGTVETLDPPNTYSTQVVELYEVH